eukprot:gene1362-11984_t
MSTKHKFDLGDYVIQFKSVLVVPEIGTAFYDFLKKEFNTDNWDFILEVNKLEDLTKKKNQKKILKQVQDIKTAFVEPKSPKEIFIGEVQKKTILQELEKLDKKSWNLEISPFQLFEPLKKLLVMEYKNDSFRRFSREPECLSLLEKYKTNRNVLLPQLSMIYNYVDEDFDSKVIEKKDREFIQKFSEDNPNWELAYNNKKTKCSTFLSNWNYLPNVSFLSNEFACIKYQMFFEYSLQQVACAVFLNYHQNDSTTVETRVLEFKNQDHAILQLNQKIGTFTELRTRSTIYSFDYEADKKKLTLIGKPTRTYDASFLKSGTINTGFTKGGDATSSSKGIEFFLYYITIFTEIAENRTMIERINVIDMGLSGVPKVLVDKRLEQFYSSTVKSIESFGEKKKIKDFKYEFTDLWEGIPLQPMGKLLYDLDIDRKDEEHRKKIEKRNQVFDLSNFTVQFSAVKKREIEEAYYSFLKKEFNTESWDFIVAFNYILNLHSKKKNNLLQIKLDELISIFIKENSAITISSQECEKILETRENLSKCIENINHVYVNVKLEHQLDSFKRFVKTPEAKLILAKYQHDVSVMNPIIDFVSIYKDDDFERKNIKDKDIQFCSSISEHASTWDQIHTNKNSKISISKVNWFQNCSMDQSSLISYELKYEFYHPIEQVANGYLTLSRMNKDDPNVNKIKLINYLEETNENYASAILGYDMVWSWKQSFLKENVCAFTTNDNQLIFVSKPIQPKDKNWFKKEEDKIQYFQYEIIVLSKTGHYSTSFQHILCINSQEKIDWNQKMIERSKSFYASVEGSISKSPPTIEELRNIFQKKENDEFKEPLGNLLLSVDFNNCQTADVTETEEDTMSSTFDDTLSSKMDTTTGSPPESTNTSFIDVESNQEKE